MNPHFIFNSINGIDNLIQTNQKDKATTYLNRFAKLIRNMLDGSRNNLVPFEKDWETIQLYIQMEQFRSNNHFNYHLHADEELLNGGYKVPPLLIQPLIENAIQHGLINKLEGPCDLWVNATLNDEHIIYTIADNGIGQKRATALRQMNKPEHQSFGTQLAAERIRLHNNNKRIIGMVVKDKDVESIDSGTLVTVTIIANEN